MHPTALPYKAQQLRCLAGALLGVVKKAEGDVGGVYTKHVMGDWEWLAASWGQVVMAHVVHVLEDDVQDKVVSCVMQVVGGMGGGATTTTAHGGGGAGGNSHTKQRGVVDTPHAVGANPHAVVDPTPLEQHLASAAHPTLAALAPTHLLPVMHTLVQWRCGGVQEDEGRGAHVQGMERVCLCVCVYLVCVYVANTPHTHTPHPMHTHHTPYTPHIHQAWQPVEQHGVCWVLPACNY